MSSKFRFRRLSEFSTVYAVFFTTVFILILIQFSFPKMDAIFYDLWVRLDMGIHFKDNVVLVYMDEESDSYLGETYPYTYATHSRVISKLTEERPALVSYFVAMTDPDSALEKSYQGQFKQTVQQYAERGGAFRFATNNMDQWGEILPPEDLRSLGYLLAQLNIDSVVFSKDDVDRRAILNISGEDSLHLWAANRYREFRGERPLSANSILGAYYDRETDATFTLFRYYTSSLDEDSRITAIPFHRVVVGNFPAGLFKDKIILVGSKYASNPDDSILTPFSKERPASRLNVHAQIIQSLLQDKTVFRVPDNWTDVLSVMIAIILSFVIFRFRPTQGLIFTLLTTLGIFSLGYLMFSLMGLWVNLTHMMLTVFIVYYIWVPFRAIVEYQRRFTIQEESKILKQVDALKQNFISFMSHDLKTPVAKIAGITDLLRTQYPNGPEQQKHLQNIVTATKELNKFISSILDLTKIEAKNLKLNMGPKDINKVIESIIESLRFEASSNEVSIDVELSPLYPINLDADLMNRVISNLTENAIKYSGKGSTIHIKTWDDEQWVYLQITDNGIGIPAKDMGHIFEKFYRVKNDSTHSIKGTGLGLYLVKYFIELHGGTISVASEVGKGTTFTVKLKNA